MHLGRCIFWGAAWLATQWCESSMSTFPSGPLRLRCDASAMALAAVSVLVIYANFCRVWPKIGTLNSPKWMVSHTLSSVWHRHLIHGDLGIPQRNPHLTCHFWFHDPTSQEALTEAAASSLAERLGRRYCHGFVFMAWHWRNCKVRQWTASIMHSCPDSIKHKYGVIC